MTSLRKRTLSGVAWNVLGTSGHRLSAGILTIVLARLLGPEEFGVVAAALIVIGFAQIFTSLGVGPALVQVPTLTRALTATGFTLSLGFGVAAAAFVYLSAPAWAAFFAMPDLTPVVRAIGATLPLTGATLIGTALLERAMAFRRLALIELVSFVLGYGVTGIALALAGAGVWALAGAHVSQSVLRALLVLRATRSSVVFAARLEGALPLLRYGLGHSVARVGNTLALQGDNLVVGRFLDSAALGVYGRAYQLAMLPVQLLGTALDKVLFPAMASIQSDRQRLALVHHSAVSVAFMLTLPIGFLLAALAAPTIALLLGPDWLAVVAPLQVLALFLAFRTSYKANESVARATGAVFGNARLQWAYAVAVVIGAVVGQSLLGVVGVAWGVGVALVAHFALTLRLASRITGASAARLLGSLLRHVAIAATVGAAALAAQAPLRDAAHDVVLLALGALAGALTWLVLFAAVPAAFGPERAELLRVARSLRRRRPV